MLGRGLVRGRVREELKVLVVVGAGLLGVLTTSSSVLLRFLFLFDGKALLNDEGGNDAFIDIHVYVVEYLVTERKAK